MGIHPHDFSVMPEPPESSPGVPTPTPYQAPAYDEKPFLRIGNICIATDRIVSVEFLPESTLFRVGEAIFYGTASAHAEPDPKKVESFKDSVVVVNYVNSNDIREFVRRWGDEALDIWLYITAYLAAP